MSSRYYKLNSILRARRHYGFIMTASWEKIYSVLGGVAKRRSPIRNILHALNIRAHHIRDTKLMSSDFLQ